MSSDIEKKLDQLANFQAQKDVLNFEKQALIDQVLTPEIKARLDEIEAEFAGRAEAVDAKIADLEAEIREDVLRAGASVKGTFIQAVWSKGRVTWDSKALAYYAENHPEVLRYRKEGNPSVSLRKVG